jgi:hypothetical protein
MVRLVSDSAIQSEVRIVKIILTAAMLCTLTSAAQAYELSARDLDYIRMTTVRMEQAQRMERTQRTVTRAAQPRRSMTYHERYYRAISTKYHNAGNRYPAPIFRPSGKPQPREIINPYARQNR